MPSSSSPMKLVWRTWLRKCTGHANFVVTLKKAVLNGSRKNCFKIFQRNSFTRQNFPDSKVTFAHAILNSGFKISGDMTEPGSFYFGFVHMFVHGK